MNWAKPEDKLELQEVSVDKHSLELRLDILEDSLQDKENQVKQVELLDNEEDTIHKDSEDKSLLKSCY